MGSLGSGVVNLQQQRCDLAQSTCKLVWNCSRSPLTESKETQERLTKRPWLEITPAHRSPQDSLYEWAKESQRRPKGHESIKTLQNGSQVETNRGHSCSPLIFLWVQNTSETHPEAPRIQWLGQAELWGEDALPERVAQLWQTTARTICDRLVGRSVSRSQKRSVKIQCEFLFNVVTYASKAQNFLHTYCSKRQFWEGKKCLPQPQHPCRPSPSVSSSLGRGELILLMGEIQSFYQ